MPNIKSIKYRTEEMQTKKVRCVHKGCNKIVEVPLYADELQYCGDHTKKLYDAFVSVHKRITGGKCRTLRA
jgi:hypothetical protein